MNKFNEDDWANLTAGTNTYFDRIITEKGMMIFLPVANTTVWGTQNTSEIDTNDTQSVTYGLVMWEANKDQTLKAGDIFIANLSVSSNNKVHVGSIAEGNMSGGQDYEDQDDENMFIGYLESDLGSKTMYDTAADENTLEIIYHGEQVYGNIFLAESDAIVSSSANGDTEIGRVTVKDNEMTSVQGKNLVVVGGSCINQAAEDILGGAYCGTDFTSMTGIGQGQFLVKVVASPYDSSKIAMLVAGYEAADTTKAVKYVTEEPDVSTTVGTNLKKETATYNDVA